MDSIDYWEFDDDGRMEDESPVGDFMEEEAREFSREVISELKGEIAHE